MSNYCNCSPRCKMFKIVLKLYNFEYLASILYMERSILHSTEVNGQLLLTGKSCHLPPCTVDYLFTPNKTMKQNSCRTAKDAKYMENITHVKPKICTVTCFDDVKSK